MRGTLATFILLFALVATVRANEIPSPVRGITVSTHRGGGDWASDDMVVTLEEIRDLGANWVAIHPYGRIGADGGVRTRFSVDSPPPHVLRPIREAKALGLKIMIKPHLAYWGSPFAWRGQIRFEEKEAWDRFWRDYEAFIVALARWSKDADAFVIGTELRGTLEYGERWRALIEKVRAETDAPLTYAANWDDFEQVTFWDALDVLGIQAYFPLADEKDVTEAAIRRGWKQWMQRVASFGEAQGKPVLFTELGYNQAYHAPVRPWDYRTDDEGARDLQELCMQVALESVESEPSVLGVFLWKWFLPPRRVGRNFQLATPRMQNVIRGQWAP